MVVVDSVGKKYGNYRLYGRSMVVMHSIGKKYGIVMDPVGRKASCSRIEKHDTRVGNLCHNYRSN